MHDTDLPEVALTTLPVGKSHEDRLEVRNSNSSFLFDVSRKKSGKFLESLAWLLTFLRSPFPRFFCLVHSLILSGIIDMV